jgi:hypothetical protein
MKTYKAYFEQDGGCDYTIGCGFILIDLEATNWDAANEELTEKLGDYGSYVNRATLLEISNELEIDVDDIRNAEEEVRKEEERKETEKQEKKELERLLNKYNK